MIDGRPERPAGKFDVIKSVTVLQPLKIMRIVQNAQNCESRFIICSHLMYLRVYAQQVPPLVLLPRRSALRRKDAVFHGFGSGVAYATCVLVAMQFRIQHANTTHTLWFRRLSGKHAYFVSS